MNPPPPLHLQSTIDSSPTPELLDQLLVAIHANDTAQRAELYRRHPELLGWSGCLQALDQFSVAIPDAGDKSQSITLELGKFELLEEIGRGGMGVVYKARQHDLQRTVAVKMILSDQLASPDEVRRFQTEARAAACLRHPNIVAIHEIGEREGRHYFVMDYVAGESLAVRLSRGVLDSEDAVSLLIRIAAAIHHLHTQGVIHRDIKPSNILLDESGEPFVTDFGLAKIFETDGGQTRTGAIVGTPSYMSPEQAAGRNDLISPRSDVYSLGAMFYEMLTGRPPFREENVLDTLVQVLEGEPTLLRHLNPAISRDLELICLRCLDKAPERRYATAAELAEDLEKYLRGDAVLARRGVLHAIKRWVRRQPGLASHWGAQAAAALIMQIHFTIESNPADLRVHRLLMGIMAGWAALSYLGQLLLAREGRSLQALVLNVLADVSLLTLALGISQGPVSSLLVIYPLLISVSGLWFRVPLVWTTTGVTAIGFLVLVGLKPDLGDPWHYPLLVLLVLGMVGIATAYQVKRVRALSRFYERRLP